MARRVGLLLVLALVLPGLGLSSTWVDVEVTCPICGTVNLFKRPASFGTYVYQDPSKFQYVFWPATTDTFLYTCRRCHYSAYMHDFENVHPGKITELAVMLEREGAIEGALVPYYEIPMADRLRVARRGYEILGRDDVFWCEFDRVAGYHYAEAGNAQQAHAVRQEALGLAESLLEKASPATRKEALVIVASMRFFTGDIPGAKRALDEAQPLTFSVADGGAEELDRYLSQLIKDFRDELLTAGQPR